jgi:hypothetical protein
VAESQQLNTAIHTPYLRSSRAKDLWWIPSSLKISLCSVWNCELSLAACAVRWNAAGRCFSRSSLKFDEMLG